MDVYDPGDAIPSAAWFLQAHGAPGDLQAALFAWNHSAAYVSDVLSWAARYAAGGAQAVSAATQPAVPAGRRRAAARRDRREGHRLRRSPARQALPVGGHRPGRLRLLRAGHDGLPRRRHHHPAHLPGSSGSSARGSRHQAAQPGDLVFFAGADGTPQAPGHVGIVIGNGKMIEAYATGYPIRIATYGQPSSPPGDQVVVGVTRPL